MARLTKVALKTLRTRLEKANGRDAGLDRDIAKFFDADPNGDTVPDYTSSVDGCLSLIASVLPSWRWHVGYGPDGILPYATLAKPIPGDDADEILVEASAPTVPLALLRAIMKAVAIEVGNVSTP